MAASKKTKKTTDSINSRLALVMKSGKGTSYSQALALSFTFYQNGLRPTWRADLSYRSNAGLQIDAEDSTVRQSKAGHHLGEHTTSSKE